MTNKMRPEIKTAWIEALRSGEYKQAKGKLYNGEGYCCLGVLCQVVADKTDDAYVRRIASHELAAFSSYVPPAVQEWLGRTAFDIDYIDKDIVYSREGKQADLLSMLNDSGMTFNQIAEIVEEQY